MIASSRFLLLIVPVQRRTMMKIFKNTASVFPKTIRARLMYATAGNTLLISIITLTICFIIFQSFLKKNQIQSSEFNLQLVANNISSDMKEIIYFSKWTCSNAEIIRYLERADHQTADRSQDAAEIRALALSAFTRLKEEYYNTTPEKYITHALISSNDQKNYLHVLGPSENSRPYGADIVHRAPYFQQLLDSSEFLWLGLEDDLFTNVNPPKVIPIIRPIYNDFNATVLGWSYISISQSIFTDYLKDYPLADDSALFITIGDNNYQLINGTFKKTFGSYTPVSEITGVSLNDNTRVQNIKLSDGSKQIIITLPLGVDGWYISQILSQQQFDQQKLFYHFLLVGIFLMILLLGAFLMYYLNRIIHVPVQKLRVKINAIAQGDFSRDPSIEWNHEFGEIGKGVNDLSGNILQLMDKRIEDEKQKKDLEYQILQSQINPHFLYNTLNSIKWMATIQGASGIAEMTTALARLLKNVSKGTSAMITLREELDLAKDYFLIQQYRYGGSITLECSIANDELYNCKIQRFTLQPIVENALFHGIEPKGQAGQIAIHAEESTDSSGRLLRLSVTDNGVGMSHETIAKVLQGGGTDSTDFFRHVGIYNVNRRIQYEFGENYGISITSEPGVYTTMTITIPYITDIPKE